MSRGVTRPSPRPPSAFRLTSRLTLKEHWDLSGERESRVHGEAEKDTVNRTRIQNQYVGAAALVQPV